MERHRRDAWDCRCEKGERGADCHRVAFASAGGDQRDHRREAARSARRQHRRDIGTTVNGGADGARESERAPSGVSRVDVRATGRDTPRPARGTEETTMSARVMFLSVSLSLGLAMTVLGQQPSSSTPPPYVVGNRLGLPMSPGADGAFNPISTNVKVFGAIYSAESCSYDPSRGVIVVPNRGVAQNVQTNNAWISFLNHDGTVHTARWIGIQNPGEQRSGSNPPLILNEPLGSDIANGILYVADRDGGTSPSDPVVSVIRRFNMQSGAPAGETRIPKSTGFNDLEAADDGTVYATQTGGTDPVTWQVWKITRDGEASIFVQGAPLRQPNGIAFDAQGNIVVVNIGSADVL